MTAKIKLLAGKTQSAGEICQRKRKQVVWRTGINLAIETFFFIIKYLQGIFMSHANKRAFESRQKTRLPMLDFMAMKVSLAWKIGVAQSYLFIFGLLLFSEVWIWSLSYPQVWNNKAVAPYSRNLYCVMLNQRNLWESVRLSALTRNEIM